MLNVQNYLINLNLPNYKALEMLKKEYGINYTLYEKENCVILSYNQIESPKFHPIVMECRGLILSGDFKKVYCKPFTRFFNYGEAEEVQKEFSFENAFVSEKVDGSLINVWYHPVKGWCFATRSRAFAEGEMDNGFSNTFFDAIMKVFPNCIPSKEELDNFFCYGNNYYMRNYTWSFEFVSPENRVVTNYGDVYALYLIGHHNNETGMFIKEFRNIFKTLQEHSSLFDFVKLPRVYNLNSLNEIHNFIKTLRNDEEGFVCYDENSDIRVKVKNPIYMEIHAKRTNGGISKSTICNMIFENEQDEYLVYFPSDKKFFEPYIAAYQKLVNYITNEFDKVKHINTSTREGKKEFALMIKDNPVKSMLFSMLIYNNVNVVLKKLSMENRVFYLEKFL